MSKRAPIWESVFSSFPYRLVRGGGGTTNASVDAANRGADGYIVKPFKMDDLIKTVKEHLRKQEDAKKHGEEKVREFIEMRATEIERGG
jgi:DNA-binding response OmpR family regulator